MEPIIVLAVLALLARVGLALYSVGLCRAKNAAGVMLRCACDLCFAALFFWGLGAAILQPVGNPVFHVAPGMLVGWDVPPGTIFVHAALFIVAMGLVGGAMSERGAFLPVCAASALLAGLVMPITGHWVWGGWLGRIGFTDIGGAAALHVAAGACAAIAAAFAGARTGKYNRDGSANMIPGHSIPMAGAGVLLTVTGWVAYLAVMALLHGSADISAAPWAQVSAAADNALLAGAAAGAAALVAGGMRYRKPDVGFVFLGLLGGLVAISAVGGAVATAPAVLIGVGAGVLVPIASAWIDLQLRLDDPAGAVAVQLVGGAWGTLAAGVLMPGSLAARLKHTGVQLVGLIVIAALSTLLSMAMFAYLRRIGRLRVTEEEEYDGLDLAEHDVAAYPDFQQNMIKSYHMREA